MGTLYLVRHGQASFGAADYDNLSALGQRQSQRLGQYLASKNLQFGAVVLGTLKRHAQTLAGIKEGLEASGGTLDATPVLWPGLNEYDSPAVIKAVHPAPLPKPDSPEMYRHHFRILRHGLTEWMNGKTQPVGMPIYPDFLKGVTSALDYVRQTHSGNVLLVSSGGPISTAMGHLLGTTPEMTIELNLRIRNTSVTEFEFNPKRHTLITYNTLPHLDGEEFAPWVTFS